MGTKTRAKASKRASVTEKDDLERKSADVQIEQAEPPRPVDLPAPTPPSLHAGGPFSEPEKRRIYAALSADFPAEAIQRTEKRAGRSYATTGVAYQHIVNRLNEVLGLGGWRATRATTVRKFERRGQHGSQTAFEAVCELSLELGRWQPPVSADQPAIFAPWAHALSDGGHISNTEGDARKGAYTNAFKKAAAFFGVGKKAYEGTLDDDNEDPDGPPRGRHVKPDPEPEFEASAPTPVDPPAEPAPRLALAPTPSEPEAAPRKPREPSRAEALWGRLRAARTAALDGDATPDPGPGAPLLNKHVGDWIAERGEETVEKLWTLYLADPWARKLHPPCVWSGFTKAKRAELHSKLRELGSKAAAAQARDDRPGWCVAGCGKMGEVKAGGKWVCSEDEAAWKASGLDFVPWLEQGVRTRQVEEARLEAARDAERITAEAVEAIRAKIARCDTEAECDRVLELIGSEGASRLGGSAVVDLLAVEVFARREKVKAGAVAVWRPGTKPAEVTTFERPPDPEPPLPAGMVRCRTCLATHAEAEACAVCNPPPREDPVPPWLKVIAEVSTLQAAEDLGPKIAADEYLTADDREKIRKPYKARLVALGWKPQAKATKAVPKRERQPGDDDDEPAEPAPRGRIDWIPAVETWVMTLTHSSLFETEENRNRVRAFRHQAGADKASQIEAIVRTRIEDLRRAEAVLSQGAL